MNLQSIKVKKFSGKIIKKKNGLSTVSKNFSKIYSFAVDKKAFFGQSCEQTLQPTH